MTKKSSHAEAEVSELEGAFFVCSKAMIVGKNNDNMVSTEPSTSKGGNLSNRILVVLLFTMLAINLYQQSLSTSGLRTSTIQSSATVRRPYRTKAYDDEETASSVDEDAPSVEHLDEEDEADYIIRRSYERSYAHILPCDDNSSGKQCMKKTLDYIHSPNMNNDTSLSNIPWWFQTLLRDTQSNGAYGFWHQFATTDPPLNFCTIGKVATTEWRKVFCKLNADDCKEPGSCGKRGCTWRTKKEMPEDAPWAVFLRDPLERLLSGFLDKCYKPRVRANEKHCEPNIVFNAERGMVNSKGKEYPSLLDNLEDGDKQFFAAYVDVLPLKWNVHFVPQAIACDLHRTIDSYDFVGKMGSDFMFDLEKMANQFGGQLPDVLNSTFAYQTQVSMGKVNMGKEKNQHATHAPAKVQQFYTAQTVRRGLELLSIDYVTLGLEVPEWARQMLRDDAA